MKKSVLRSRTWGAVALIATAGCYGAAPPRPERISYPNLADASLTVDTERTTSLEKVRKKSHQCPQGHAAGSSKCLVTTYEVTEPVTRTTTTVAYGGQPLDQATFLALTDPDYDEHLATLEAHRKACDGANLPRRIGAGLAIAGLVTWTIAASYGSRGASVAGAGMLAGGTSSYALGYYVFGGKRCHEAERMYRELDYAQYRGVREIRGARAAEEARKLADEFNARAARHATTAPPD